MHNNLTDAIGNGSKSAFIKKRIFKHYIINGNSTITNLAKDLDLSVPTVTKQVEEMCAAGYIQTFGKLETNGGRHPLLYGLCADCGYFVGIDVKQFTISMGVIDMKGDMIEQALDVKYKFDNSPEGLEEICEKISQFIDSLTIDRKKIMNINVNLSGRVNTEQGYSYTYFNFSDRPLSELLQKRLGYPVSVDNDTRAMTYGEFVCGAARHERNVLFINVSWGLGLGIIIDGKLYTGKSGFAGEFGHIPAFDNEVLCHCGKKGCLETEASGRAFYRKLVQRLQNGETSCLLDYKNGDISSLELDDIMDAIAKEDVLSIDIVEEIGENLGKNIAGLINIFNPELVVIGGIMAAAGDYLLQPVRSAIRKHSLNLVNQDTRITLSELADSAGPIGSCMLSRAHMFDN